MSVAAKVIGPDDRTFQTKIKTLLLDDSTFDRARIRRMSNKSELMVDMNEVSDIAELKHAITHEVFDLILIDCLSSHAIDFKVIEKIKLKQIAQAQLAGGSSKNCLSGASFFRLDFLVRFFINEKNEQCSSETLIFYFTQSIEI